VGAKEEKEGPKKGEVQHYDNTHLRPLSVLITNEPSNEGGRGRKVPNFPGKEGSNSKATGRDALPWEGPAEAVLGSHKTRTTERVSNSLVREKFSKGRGRERNLLTQTLRVRRGMGNRAV